MIETAIRTRVPLISEYRVVHQDGTVRWINALGNTTYDHDGVPLRMLGICTDITDRKHAEEALNENEKRYRGLLNNLEAGVVVHAPDTSIILSNPAAQRLLGLSEDQMKGKLAIDPRWCFLKENKTPFEIEDYPVNQVIRYKKPAKNLMVGVNRPETNDIIWAIVNGFPVFDDEGSVSEVLISFIEITHRMLAEQEILKLNETLENRVAERTAQLELKNKELKFHLSEIEQFSYITTHDLQEPLRTINTFAKLIHEGYSQKLDEDGNNYIDFIYNSASRMSELVKGLLEYSLLGKESSKGLVDCDRIVKDATADLSDSIIKNRVKISLLELPILNGFAKELRLLFQNLIENAVKFHRPGIDPVIEISAHRDGRNWLFSVADNGIGIDEKDREKMFIIFRRVHNRNEYQGTGIGLAHCKKIAELHGGKIWVESAAGSGCIFRFTLPA
jgi:PAS domain S-box-containing protein